MSFLPATKQASEIKQSSDLGIDLCQQIGPCLFIEGVEMYYFFLHLDIKSGLFSENIQGEKRV